MKVIIGGLVIGFVVLALWFLLACFLEWLDVDGVFKSKKRLIHQLTEETKGVSNSEVLIPRKGAMKAPLIKGEQYGKV